MLNNIYYKYILQFGSFKGIEKARECIKNNKVSKEITNYAKEIVKPILKAQDEDTYAQAYSDFYDSLMD